MFNNVTDETLATYPRTIKRKMGIQRVQLHPFIALSENVTMSMPSIGQVNG